MPFLPAIPGLPDWLGFLLLLAVLGFGLAFLMMPFAVFGIKSRLEAIEQRLLETDEALRMLARQVAAQPGLARATDVDDLPISAIRRTQVRPPAPIGGGAPPVPPPPVLPSVGAARTEPRIDWPRNR